MKKIFFLCLLAVLLTPTLTLAQNESSASNPQTFEARVLEILEQRQLLREDGSKNIQQNIKLKGLEGDFKDRNFIYDGIGNLDVVSSNLYERGDRAVVNYSRDADGNDKFYIIDYVRRGQLYFLAFIFALVVVLVGRWKGIKSLISLVVTFFIIMKFMIPLILSGNSPVLIGVIGSFFILLFVVYLTEGWNRRSHIAVFGILMTLVLTYVLSALFSGFTKLTGTAPEEVGALIELKRGMIDFRGLLLASILIGTLGVLDDVVLSQVEAVAQIKEANPALPKRKVFGMAFKIGTTHLGAVINTLFLAYAGASLPLLLLFGVKEPPFLTFGQVINNEIIATEIVRTLVGSIGLALAVPIATFSAVFFLRPGEKIHEGRARAR
ncbi:MAG: YibE/F family protein [Patescibacteria group bacterium]